MDPRDQLLELLATPNNQQGLLEQCAYDFFMPESLYDFAMKLENPQAQKQPEGQPKDAKDDAPAQEEPQDKAEGETKLDTEEKKPEEPNAPDEKGPENN